MSVRASGAPRLVAVVVVILLAAVGVATGIAVLLPGADGVQPGDRRGAPAGDSAALPPVLPEVGAEGDSTCTDPSTGTEWRVSWEASAFSTATAITPTGFWSRRVPGATPTGSPGTPSPDPSVSGPTGLPTTVLPTVPMPTSTVQGVADDRVDEPARTDRVVPAAAAADGWTSRRLDTWQLRWSAPAQPSELGNLLVEKDERGNLDRLDDVRTPANWSPRYVSPDGGCTVYVTPFGRGDRGRPTVAVLGDSLVAQLGPEQPPLTGAGMVHLRLLDRAERPEVTGQGGRRWTQVPGSVPGLDSGDGVLLDEIRGLRGAKAQVIALGTNDAGWVAMAPDEDQFELRLAWVLFRLTPILDELRDAGQCAVLLTAEDRGVTYLGARQERYAEAAQRINGLVREHANASSTDDLHVWDWATITATHHTADLDPWFGPDTVHLNEKGRQQYANELVNASTLC